MSTSRWASSDRRRVREAEHRRVRDAVELVLDRRRRSPGGGGRGRCTTATRRRRCRRCRRCRRASCRSRVLDDREVLVGPALLLGERVPEDAARVEVGELGGGASASCARQRYAPDSRTAEPPRCVAVAAARRIEVRRRLVVGAASLGAEIAAARLLAPWFGASTIVWANTIATVLVALSVGYWVGGRLADRDPTLRRAVPGRARAPRACWRSCPSSPGRSCASPSTRSTASRRARSSARCSPCSCSSPCRCCCSGAVAPYAVRLSVAHGRGGRPRRGAPVRDLDARRRWSGSFLSALLLIPLVGTRRTFLAFALALALVAVPGAAGGASCSRPSRSPR